jgi:copper chaperone
MQHIIEVENIKCGGCANTITGRLGRIDGVGSVEVDIEHGRITEKGSVEGMEAAKARAKSFVSCAIGKMGS